MTFGDPKMSIGDLFESSSIKRINLSTVLIFFKTRNGMGGTMLWNTMFPAGLCFISVFASDVLLENDDLSLL